MAAIGSGFDVTELDGAKIVKPLTLTFEAAPPSQGLVPVVAHQRHDGEWEYLPAAWDGKTATVQTANFSPNLLAWFDPAKWMQAAKDRAVEFFSGRTPPPPCKGGAHSWGTAAVDTDMVHSCLISNDAIDGERVEVQLTSNRGEYVQVDVPSADYVWVDGQNAFFRRQLGRLFGIDGERSVLLPPGGRMTVGFRRPAVNSNPVLRVSPSTPAMGMSLIDALIGGSGLELGGEKQRLMSVVAWCGLRANQGALRSGDPRNSSFWSTMQCVTEDATKNLANPETALGAARDLYGPSMDANELSVQRDKLMTLSSRLQNVGIALKVFSTVTAARDFIMAGWGTFSDQLVDLLTGSRGYTIALDLRTAPTPRASTAPQTPPSPRTPKPQTSTAPGPQPSPPPPPPPPAPAPTPNPPFPGGYVIEDSFLGGTWPRTDPNDGTWYGRGSRPSNAADYWWNNGLGVGFSCAASAAPYTVKFVSGRQETWRTWLRSTDTWGGRVVGLWVPSAVADKVYTDGIPPGMPTC